MPGAGPSAIAPHGASDRHARTAFGRCGAVADGGDPKGSQQPRPRAAEGAAPAPATPPPTEGRMDFAGPIDGHPATDPRLAAKPTARSGRARPSRHGPPLVSAPRPRTFGSSQFRRIESRL